MSRQPRKLEEPPVPVVAVTLTRTSEASDRSDALWLRVRTEYITSPDQPSLETLAKKYEKQVGYEAIRKRCAAEKWLDERERWWTEAETRLLGRIQDEYLSERLKEMREIAKVRGFVFAHLMPLTDPKTGEPILDAETGLPKFPHGFRSQESVAKTYLMLQERGMLLRGEAISRTESALRDRQAEEDPLAALAANANFTREEIRKLARDLLARRLTDPPAQDEPEGDADGGDDDEL